MVPYFLLTCTDKFRIVFNFDLCFCPAAQLWQRWPRIMGIVVFWSVLNAKMMDKIWFFRNENEIFKTGGHNINLYDSYIIQESSVFVIFFKFNSFTVSHANETLICATYYQRWVISLWCVNKSIFWSLALSSGVRVTEKRWESRGQAVMVQQW